MSSVATLAHGGSLPELLLSLSYNEMTGRLCVEVVKGSHFRNLAMAKPPGMFVYVMTHMMTFFSYNFLRKTKHTSNKGKLVDHCRQKIIL